MEMFNPVINTGVNIKMQLIKKYVHVVLNESYPFHLLG